MSLLEMMGKALDPTVPQKTAKSPLDAIGKAAAFTGASGNSGLSRELNVTLAAIERLVAAADAVTTNPQMATVRGRLEMQRRLRHLGEALAPFGGAK